MNDIGWCYEKEMKEEKTEVIRIQRQPSPVQIMDRSKTKWRISTISAAT